MHTRDNVNSRNLQIRFGLKFEPNRKYYPLTCLEMVLDLFTKGGRHDDNFLVTGDNGGGH